MTNIPHTKKGWTTPQHTYDGHKSLFLFSKSRERSSGQLLITSLTIYDLQLPLCKLPSNGAESFRSYPIKITLTTPLYVDLGHPVRMEVTHIFQQGREPPQKLVSLCHTVHIYYTHAQSNYEASTSLNVNCDFPTENAPVWVSGTDTSNW